MQRNVTSRGLAIVCAMGLALGAGACAGDDRPAAMDEEREPIAASETPTEDPAMGASAEPARVTGCLERGSIDGTFVLAQARTEGEAGSVGTTGSEATGSQQFSLIHTGDTDLTSYVGSRVAVTGRIQDSSGVSAPEAGMQPGSGAPTADTAPIDEPGADTTGDMASTAGAGNQIVVEQVERVEGECPAE